ncbi:hypothetical protein ACVWZD_005517 [Streptomyces sp. TE3672]
MSTNLIARFSRPGRIPVSTAPQGDHVREAIHLLHTGSSSVRIGTGVVSGMCANGIRAADDLRAAVDDLATG